MSSVRRCLQLLSRGRLSSLRPTSQHVVPYSTLISVRNATKQPPIYSIGTSLVTYQHPLTPHSQHHQHLCTVVSKAATASRPKAVIFDLGGVVVPSPQGIFDRFEEKHALDKGSLVATIKSSGTTGAFAKMERGEYTTEEFCEPFRTEYVAYTSHDISIGQVQEFIKQLSDFTKVTPHSCVLDMFKRLQEAGIKVAILTNNFRRNNGTRVFPEEQLKNVDLVS